jgi:pimeloyl-ACP methyl ester carboxylesterase
MPGLVPDAPETFLRQRHLFLAYGSVTAVTYGYETFDLELLLAGLRERITAAAAMGEAPVLFGVSIGGGIVLELLRRCAAAGEPLPLAGLVLVSPFTCTADLAPLLRRMIEPILGENGEAAREGLERGRSFFRMLASRSVPADAPTGWRKGLSLLTPSGLRAWQERAILARIDRTLASITPEGALARVRGLRHLRGVGQEREALCRAPTLILWGSKERQTLSMDGPGTGILCRPDLAYRLFPDAEVQWVYGAGGEEVPHASLIKHAHAFNPHLKRFLRRLPARIEERLARGA